ncbi:MAG TPA: TetR/AcrR family transcriptional regulator [Solirubrobacteraceae bacterium]|nr:TetR/AcrR family transcriptional regulator [Solirubrobacteraceae bacterium]
MQYRRELTQRERLLEGMIAVVNRDGYAGASVPAVLAAAGVPFATFEEHFADRDDVFRAAIEDVALQMAALVRTSIDARPASEASLATVEALVAFASAEPAGARFELSEALAGGAQGRDARDAGIAAIAEAIEQALATVPQDTVAPDIEHRVLIGGVYRLIAPRLRRGEPAISRLADVLEQWLSSYARPLGEHRWRTLRPAPRPDPSPHVPDAPIQRMPNALPPGQPRVSEEEAIEQDRLRILYAAARMAERNGYLATTVADITDFAGVEQDVFYRLFADKQDAFLAVHELGYAQLMDLTSKAFFSGASWPLRSWEGGRALTQVLEDNPLVAHIGFVEAYAVGPAAIQRVEDSHIAFTFFLHEGLVYRPLEHPPSGLAMEAIVACIFEIIYLQSRDHGTPEVATMLPHIAHLWLTPFLGSRESDEFIDAQGGDPQAYGGASARDD